jgi:hypothetical protein
MATVTPDLLPQVIAMMAVAPEPPPWWGRRRNRDMPRARREQALVDAARDVARARGITPAEISPRLIEIAQRGVAMAKSESHDANEPAVVLDIQLRLADAKAAYAYSVDQDWAVAWRAKWAVMTVGAALDAVAAQFPPPIAPAPAPQGATKA